MSIFAELRKQLHQMMFDTILGYRNEPGQTPSIATIADSTNKPSIAIAIGIIENLGITANFIPKDDKSTGGLFVEYVKDFLEEAFGYLAHLRPGPWYFDDKKNIGSFIQYDHLAKLKKVSRDSNQIE